MDEKSQHLDTIRDIKKMMERSSRFISLSGLSGVAAGICALIGAWFGYDVVHGSHGDEMRNNLLRLRERDGDISVAEYAGNSLLKIGLLTFAAAFVLAFIFTYIRSRKNHTPLWGTTARRLMINVCIPIAAGGIYLIALMKYGAFGLIAPGCLIFYGLALINASKYTLVEIRYLGYGQLILGIINLLYPGYGLYFWAFGFGILHIVYGTVMWWKYERNSGDESAVRGQ